MHLSSKVAEKMSKTFAFCPTLPGMGVEQCIPVWMKQAMRAGRQAGVAGSRMQQCSSRKSWNPHSGIISSLSHLHPHPSSTSPSLPHSILNPKSSCLGISMPLENSSTCSGVKSGRTEKTGQGRQGGRDGRSGWAAGGQNRHIAGKK